MQRAFLPTMADDMLAVAQQALGRNLLWYRKLKKLKKLKLLLMSSAQKPKIVFALTTGCPNGHPCTVGEVGHI